MDTNTNLDDILGVSSDDMNQEPIQKERKKPGPKPKPKPVTDEIFNDKLDEKSQASQLDEVHNEELKSSEDVVDLSVKETRYEFKHPAVLYRTPSDKLPLCRVSFIKLTGSIINNYAECYALISGVGKVHGYVNMNVSILELLSRNH